MVIDRTYSVWLLDYSGIFMRLWNWANEILNIYILKWSISIIVPVGDVSASQISQIGSLG